MREIDDGFDKLEKEIDRWVAKPGERAGKPEPPQAAIDDYARRLERLGDRIDMARRFQDVGESTGDHGSGDSTALPPTISIDDLVKRQKRVKQKVDELKAGRSKPWLL